MFVRALHLAPGERAGYFLITATAAVIPRTTDCLCLCLVDRQQCYDHAASYGRGAGCLWPQQGEELGTQGRSLRSLPVMLLQLVKEG